VWGKGARVQGVKREGTGGRVEQKEYLGMEEKRSKGRIVHSET